MRKAEDVWPPSELQHMVHLVSTTSVLCHIARQAALERQDLSCTYLAQHELGKGLTITIIDYATGRSQRFVRL